MFPPMRRVLGVMAAVVFLGGCSAKESFDEKRGRSDAPVKSVDDSAKKVIQMPDRFSNIAHACDGNGNRVFTTTKSDNSRALFVIRDPSCGGEVPQ